MTFRTWGGSPPPSGRRTLNIEEPHPQDPMFLLGAIFERTNTLVREAEWVRHRLEQGADQFISHEGRLSNVEAKVSSMQKASSPGDEIPRWEKIVKRWAAFLIPGAVLAGTGQLSTALEWAKLLK